MKRLISILSCLAILAACLVVPVSADFESDIQDGKLMEVLDYGNSIEYEDNSSQFFGSGCINFNLPYYDVINYIDAVVTIRVNTGKKVTGVNLLRNGKSIESLNFVAIGQQTYRVFGEFTHRSFNEIGLEFVTDQTEDYVYFTVKSLKVGLYFQTTFNHSGTANIYPLNSAGLSIKHRVGEGNEGFGYWDGGDDYNSCGVLIDLFCVSTHWQRYDYIDFHFALDIATINSIVVYLNDQLVPHEVSFINGDFSESSVFHVLVRVDLSEVDRSVSSDTGPVVSITGISHFSEGNSMMIYDIVGHLKYVYENPVIYWFKKVYKSLSDGFNNVVNELGEVCTGIVNKLGSVGSSIVNNLTSGFNSVVSKLTSVCTSIVNNLTSGFSSVVSKLTSVCTSIVNNLTTGFQSVVDAILGNTSDLENSGDDMKDAADDLNDMGDAFNEIDRPDIDVSGLTQNYVNFSPFGLSVLAVITSNSYVSSLLLLVFTFALCSYVLFGKR